MMRHVGMLMSCVAWLLCLAWLACADVTPVTVDFARNAYVPLLKKYAVYNSGMVYPQRYTPAVLQSLGLIKAAALRIDLSIGKAATGFTDLITGTLDAGDSGGLTLNMTLIDGLTQGLLTQQVMPYWGLSYNPHPFQLLCKNGTESDNADCEAGVATCRGFEHLDAVPGTNNYTCTPNGASPFDDCWKCPPKAEDDEEYSHWGAIVARFHSHMVELGATPLYEEMWNEPDLTDYYGPSLAAFKGSSDDYNAMYASCATKLAAADQDVMYGGLAVAKQIQHNPDYPEQPNNEDTLLAAAEQGLAMDFMSYHSITSAVGADQVSLVLSRAETARNVLASGHLLNITGELNRFAATELHCNEFYPNSTTAALTTAYASSAHLATELLQAWTTFLGVLPYFDSSSVAFIPGSIGKLSIPFKAAEETDISMIHWAQYTDIFNTSDQIGLVDFYGNPRPAWWAFRWYAELPVERVELDVDSPFVNGAAAFSERTCSGGVLLWNVPTPANSMAAEAASLSVRLRNVPLANFTIAAYVIDDRRKPQGGLDYAPSAIYANQAPDSNGSYLFPPAQYSGVKLPVNGTIYLSLQPSNGCPAVSNAANPMPSALIARLHYYYGMRPNRTSLYAHFHKRDWTAYLGMGQEVAGHAITGVTVKMAYVKAAFNISMQLLDGNVTDGGILGVRMDLSTIRANTISAYEQGNSFFFYQTGTAPCAAGVAGVGSLPPPPPPGLDLSAGAPPAPQGSGVTPLNSSIPATNYLFSDQNMLAHGVSNATNGRRLAQISPPLACGPLQQGYAQIPNLWGSKSAVPPPNFIPVDLSDFLLHPSAYATPSWDGRLTLLSVLKDGTPGTKVRMYVTGQDAL